jgi:nucleoside-diphosphate-sugar epimerase
MARILVIGGTGIASAHCSAALLGKGHEVFVFRRGTARPTPLAKGLSAFSGDRNDPARLALAMAEIAPECVIDFACFNEEQARILADVLPPTCRQLVFVSTVDAYGLPLPRLPMIEARPWAEPGSAYAAAKLGVEGFLHSALRAGRSALTIVRPTYSFGDGFLISLVDRSGAELVSRLRRGAPVLLPDGGSRLIHASDARDTGRMIALVVGADAAMWRDYTVGTPGGTMTQRGYLELVARALGVEPVFRHVDAADLDRDGVLAGNSLWHELTRHDLSFDLGRFTTDFPGFKSVGDREAQIRAYAVRLDPAEDAVRSEGPEASALRALSAVA